MYFCSIIKKDKHDDKENTPYFTDKYGVAGNR